MPTSRATDLAPSKRPTAIAAPTWQCVVDSGHPCDEPWMMTKAAPSSMQEPRDGVTAISSTPMALMIL